MKVPETLVDVLRQRATEQADDVAYVFLQDGKNESSRLTYGELDRRARAIAARLQRRSGSGERVLLLFTPGLEFISAFFGCLYAGAVAVPSYPPRPGRSQPRLRALAGDARPGRVLGSAAVVANAADLCADIPELAAAEWIAAGEVPDSEADGLPEPRRPAAGSLAFLQYTSGSTSDPKGVMVGHGNLLANEEVIRTACAHTSASTFVSWLPMYHDMGLIGSVLQPLYIGAPCILMSPAAFLQRPLRWLQAITTYRAHTSGAPDFAYDLCVRRIAAEDRAQLDLGSWEVAFNGAEPVRADTLARFAAAFAPCGFRSEAFFPCYGLAEATLIVSGRRRPGPPHVVALRDLDRGRAVAGQGGHPLVSCGTAGVGLTALIADPDSRMECPAESIGEIWVAGPSVAQGYWNRAEETRLCFQAELAGGGDGRRFLRTGDLGFVRGGELFVTGRSKDLLIVRGRNHYPQDLEATAGRSHPALRIGGAAAFAVEEEGARLVLVHEMERRAKAPLQEVAAAIRQAVAAEHEVEIGEVVLVRADAVPKTSSGKVRRRACRDLYLAGELPVLVRSSMAQPELPEAAGGPDRRAEILAAPPGERRALVEDYLWRRLGGRPATGAPSAPLAALGLDSLRVFELQQRVEADLGCSLALSDLFSAAGPAALADLVLAQWATPPDHAAGLPAAGEEEVGDHPMSHGQQALWLVDRLAPASAAYNLAAAGIWKGLGADRLAQAMCELAARHPALRTTVVVRDGTPAQRVHERLDPELVRADASGWSTAELLARVAAEASRPFDLTRGPLLRVSLFSLAPDRHALVLVAHHVIADLWSFAVLLRELGALCQARPEDAAPPSLPPLPLRYADAVRRQRRRLEGDEGERLWAYWRQRLAGELPVLDLATDRPRPPLQTYKGAARIATWDEDLAARLRALGRGRGATLAMTLLAGWFALLHRLSGQDDLLVGSPAAGRESADLAGVVGYFVNPVVVRTRLTGATAFAELLQQVSRRAAEAFEHQAFPLALLAERLHATRDPARSPLFQVLFTFQSVPFPGARGIPAFALGRGGVQLEIGACQVETLQLEERRALFDLGFAAAELGGRLAASLQFNTDLFEPSSAERMLAQLRSLLAAAASDPALAVADLSLLSEAERHQALREWNATRAAVPAPAAVHRLFAAQAARTPDGVAIEHEAEHFSYSELRERSRRIAHRLRQLGVGPEARIGLCMERSPRMVAGVLGVLEAGGAYVPLDPAYPRERLELMLRDSGVRLVLTEAVTSDLLAGAGVSLLRLDAAAHDGACPPGGLVADPAGTVLPESLAYVLYTSGSTGRPKGVQIQHRSLANVIEHLRRALGAGQSDVLLSLTTLSFDIAAAELFLPLTSGGRLALARRGANADGALLAREIERCGATLTQATPASWQLLLEAGWQGCGRLRAIATGEALPPKLGRRLATRVARLWNYYGPTETTIFSSFQLVHEGDGTIPIGRPVANTSLHVLDRGRQPVPPGVPGDLYIGGLGLARGYHGRPDLTAAAFLPDPWAEEPGARLYHSGDLARRLGDGEIEFLGRDDAQVKLHGHRIELGEIEANLENHPAVARAIAVVRDHPSSGLGDLGARRLVAYAMPRAGAAIEGGELRAFLEGLLPGPLLPSAVVVLPSFPLTPSGKIDRRALPPPAGEEPAGAAPRGPLQETIAALWCEVLEIERAGLDDSFFALGGHSLLASRLLVRVRETLRVEVPLAGLFAAPTVAGLAARIAAARGQVAPPPLDAAPRAAAVPLSPAQLRLWFLHHLAPGSAAYNIALEIALEGPLVPEALAAATAGVVCRHEALRTTVRRGPEGPAQVVSAAASPALTAAAAPRCLPRVDLSLLPAPGRTAVAERLAHREACRPFDLESGPPVRFLLLRTGAEHHRLVVTVHHLVADGGSVQVLAHELAVLYAACTAGASASLPEPPLQLCDYVVWKQRWLEEDGEAGLAYWRRQLAGAPASLELPEDRPRPPLQSFAGGLWPLALSPPLLASLDALARRRGATRFMALLAGFQLLLHRTSGQQDVVVGSPFFSTGCPGVERAVGLFVDTVALRTRFGGDGFARLLDQVRDTCIAAHQYQHIGLERLVDELQGERDLSRNPLFQALFVLDRLPPEEAAAGVVFRPGLRGTASAKVDLSLYLVEGEGQAGLAAALEYATALFEAATAGRMAGHLLTLLAAAAADPEASVADLPLLTAAERTQLLDEWNDTAAEPPGEVCLHELFARQLARTPDATALSWEGRRWTYAELGRAANRLAHFLIDAGAGPESVVGICAERSPELMVGLLSILTSGAAYLPLDPAYPRERLAFMLGDAGATILLTQEKLAGLLADGGARVVLLEAILPRIDRFPATPPRGRALPDNPAYVIYTSGSTGRPKGVVVAHRGICNRLLWMQRTYGLTAADRVLQKTSIGFDVSVWELFWPLITGATLVLARPGGQQDPTYLARVIEEQSITTVHFVPPMLGAFLAEADLAGCGSLARVLCSGEALPVELVERFRSRLGAAELHNLYGPTEASVDVTAWRCAADGAQRRVPIGRPITGMRAHVLDARLQPQPIGVSGQLHLGGVGLARGYTGRPDLTAERFVPDAWSASPGERLYQTGDLVRHGCDGSLDFLGRIDHQVKIRGFRIELGEIEAVLARHPAIREAVATAEAGNRGDRRLVAYLVTRDGTPVPAAELRGFLARALPEVMIPGDFIFLARLPLGANGKLDRRALAALRPERGEPRPGLAAPRGPLEERLAAIWGQVLGSDDFGVDDNFFELGGDSIRSIQVRALARGMGLDLSLQQIFAHRTIAGLAREVRRVGAGAAPEPPPAPFALLPPGGRERLPDGLEDAYPLSRLQEGLVFHSEYSADYEVYITSFRVRSRFDARALRGALARLVSRHPMLRTSFDLAGFAEPIQRVHRHAAVPLAVEDLRALPPGAREQRLAHWAEARHQEKFAWDRAPFARLHVHLLDDQTFHCALVHPIFDGWSMALLTTELFQSYAALLHHREPQLPPPPSVTYRDFVVLERAILRSPAARAFWNERLRGAVRPQLPRWQRRPDDGRTLHARLLLEIPADTVQGLRSLVRTLAAPLKNALLAAHLRVVGLLAGQTEATAGLLANGRPEETDGDRVAGLFLNAVPLRVDVGGGSWEELVQSAFTAEWEVLPFRRFPLAELLREHGGALFETVFNFTHFHVFAGLQRLEGVEVLGASAPSDQTYFPLTVYFNLDPISGRLHLALDYDTRELGEELVERIAGYHLAAMAAMAQHPRAPHDGFCLLAPEERDQVLTGWNRSAAPLPAATLVHQLVAAQAARTPQAVAMLQDGHACTYEELDRRSRRLAWRLRRLGVGPEVAVGICLRRTLDLPVAVVGVLAAGGAYVPLDPSYPRERLAFMMRDSRARVLIAEPGLQPGLAPEGVSVLYLDAPAAGGGDPPAGADQPAAASPAPGALPENAAYVIYTSGSTGRPKGVVVPHRGVVNFLLSMRTRPGLGPEDRLFAVTSLSFDIAVLELLLPLAVGAQVVLASAEVTSDGERLVETLASHSPTVMQATPATWRLMLEAGWAGTPELRAWCGGEALPRDLAEAVLARTRALWNLYGPTETTVWSTAHRVEAGQPRVPLGQPVANTQVLLLDAHLQPAPLATPAEIYLGGAGVVRGYTGRSELTAERFVPSPFGEPGSRLYRTGDLARRLPDGELEFLGRIDHQVKVRGFRIELAEIEAVLAEHPAVREAAVVARVDGAGGTRLTACVAGVPGVESPAADDLRAWLRQRLPEHMLPAAFVQLPALPLTANRKLDRRALLDLAATPVVAARQALPPRDVVELQLARLWAEVLDLPAVGVTDDFFELGGHSLLALRLLVQVRKRFRCDLPLSALFRGATVERLAALVRHAPTSDPVLVAIQPRGARPPLFCVHPVGGSVLCYAELARQLGPEQPCFGLQAPELAGGAPLPRVEDRARTYIAAVRRVQPAGPYRLGGWSMGAVVAFEMAQQLTRQGEAVDLLALLDAECPGGALHSRGSRDFPDSHGSHDFPDSHDSRDFPDFPDSHDSHGSHDSPTAAAAGETPEELAARWFARDLAGRFGVELDGGSDLPAGGEAAGGSGGLAELLDRARAARIVPADLELADVEGLFALFKSNLAALRAYVAQPYPGRLLLVRATARNLAAGAADLGWGGVAAGGIDVHQLAGDHYSLLHQPLAGALAAILAAHLGSEPVPQAALAMAVGESA
jgi:amino acid adenylation domain-containing protein